MYWLFRSVSAHKRKSLTLHILKGNLTVLFTQLRNTLSIMDTAQLCKLYSESTRFEIQVTEGNTGVASSFRPLYKRIMRQYV